VQVNATTSLSHMEVVCDMPGLTSRAGTALLTGLADALGLTEGLVRGLSVHSRAVRHEPGRVARDVAVMLADGGDCLTDLGALRDDQGLLFGTVASDATAYRCLERLDEEMLARIRKARAAARARAWQLGEAPRRLILDFDATLLTAYSEKEGAAGNYKGGFGFHPLLCCEASTGEALAGILRPGNAGSNTAADHVTLLKRALAQVPEGALNRGTLVRCDSAGATHGFLDVVVALDLSFSVGLDLTERVRAAILALRESAWVRALDSAGDPREGAWVAELPLDLSAWPPGTRAICRRERPHPGAQLSFSDAGGHRFQVILTNQKGSRIARLEQVHRQRAAIEDSGTLRQGLRAAQPALPFVCHERRLAGARAHRHRPALLDKAAAASRHEARRLRTEAPQVPPAARRRADRQPLWRREAAPTARLALGADPGDRLHAPAGLTVRLTSGRPFHIRRRSGAGFSMP
jgi:Transposase DDE domain group 1